MKAKAVLITAVCGLLWQGAATRAAESFAGKTISIYVGSAPGGGYDIYSRVIARHLGRFIPGHPQIIVQNMPGAGGAKAASYIANVAPRDGTAIGAISPGVVVGPLLGGMPARNMIRPRSLISQLPIMASASVSRQRNQASRL